MKIELPLDGSTQGRARTLSRAVFGSKYALEALALMAQEERFFQGQLASITGCGANQIGEFLRRLEGEGLIESVTSEPGQQRKYYRRRASPVWESALSLLLGLIDEAPAVVTSLPKRQ